MGPRTLEEYSKDYKHIRMKRRDGILELALHTDGAELIYGMYPHVELSNIWADVTADPENKVLIFTGTGDGFIDKHDDSIELGAIDPYIWGGLLLTEAKRAVMSQLETPMPMIAAINGPVRAHGETALLCDIVLASENVTFQDAFHFPIGIVPGDGTHVVWPLLLGLNRARYFLLTGQVIDAHEAKTLGLVNEVLRQEDLLARAWELAEMIAQKPRLTLRLTREALLQNVKKLMVDGLGYGMLMEGMAGIDHWPARFPE